MFKPSYIISNDILNVLIEIEKIKNDIGNILILPKVMKTLRESTKLQSVHYSTAIEGNELTEDEVKDIIIKNKKIVSKSRDEREIKGYYLALNYIEDNIDKPITEEFIKNIHALVEGGGRSRVEPTQYRDGQNVIRDSGSGRIVYMPPEAKDVPMLMKDFVNYINFNMDKIQAQILAAIVHYQFVTIHPYYDGNGRTARLLTNFILYKKKYDLNGIYSLEEYYAKDLQKYYKAISIGEHHNYYFGRVEADITPWIEYFILGMLESFKNIKKHAEQYLSSDIGKSKLFRSLESQERKILILFDDSDKITSNDVVKLFGFTQRSARNLINKLVLKGFLKVENKTNKNRKYSLGEDYLELVI